MGAGGQGSGGGVLVPILDGAWRSAQGHVLDLTPRRVAPNLWELTVGESNAPAVLRLMVELDVCGAWLTLANVEHRPIVLRRAGWVDLRGHAGLSSTERWDRVGLGPGDAIVMIAGTAADDRDLMRILLDLAGAAADRIVDTVHDELAAATVALRVPELGREDSLDRLVGATGQPRARFVEPLHPVGSPESELWSARPDPPREARLRVQPTVEAVPRTRGLLRRLMASWRMPELLDGPLELLATELVTNAVIHARTPIDVVVIYDGTTVRCEVHDRNPVVPCLVEPDLDAESGRGIWLVSTLADDWNVERDAEGKHVWFVVAA